MTSDNRNPQTPERSGATRLPSDLPDALPIFPLQGALLLPRGQLPLNIFEPRYLAMIDDALAGHRMIGMIQPRERERIDPSDSPPLYKTGCLGRLTSFNETEDGRYLITLTGLCRFDIAEELEPGRGYRRVRPDYEPYLTDMADPANEPAGVDRERLLNALSVYLEKLRLSADWDAIRETPTNELISVMAMLCPFASSEKQALLEARTSADRGDMMISLMNMAGLHPTGADDDEPSTPPH